jgi:hypothetical protein
MAQETIAVDSQSVFCEVCLKSVPRSAALMAETRDYVAYFCGEACYAKWSREPAPETRRPAVQEGRERSPSVDDQLKRIVRQHPLRDEPRADSVEPDEIPPP